jgi:integrase
MALIAKGPNRWEFQAERGRDALTGRRRRRSVTFEGTKRQAERAHALFLAETAGEAPSARATVGQLLDAWLEQKAALSPTTRQEYVRLIERRIHPALGSMLVSKLTAWELDRFYRALTAADLSAGSVRQVHAILRGALNQAKRWKWISENPAVDASPPPLRRQPVKPPTLAAVRLLIAKAGETDPDLSVAVRLAAATGARRGELCALRWTDVDLDTGHIRINRSIAEVKGRGSIVKATKSYAERTVAIDSDTVGALKLWRDAQAERAGTAHLEMAADPYILSRSPTGVRPWTPSNLSAAWAALCKANGSKGVRFHDLRHFSVTNLLDAGLPVAVVAQRHGHRDANVTLGVYGHPVDGRDRLAADTIGRALNPGHPGSPGVS